jgi:hypothetical protein
LVLAVAAVLAAGLAARSALLSSSAAGARQMAVRTELKLGAAMVEDVRYVYNTEGPRAFRIAAARVRAEEYGRRADASRGDVAAAMRIEANAQRLTADTLVQSEAELDFPSIAADDTYLTPSGGYDLGRRLTDVRAENPDLVVLDPAGIQAEGEHKADLAVKLLGATVPVGFAFMFGALGQAYTRRRRGLLVGAWVALGVAVVLAVLIEVTA